MTHVFYFSYSGNILKYVKVINFTKWQIFPGIQVEDDERRTIKSSVLKQIILDISHSVSQCHDRDALAASLISAIILLCWYLCWVVFLNVLKSFVL